MDRIMPLAGLWVAAAFGVVACEDAPSEPRMVPISQVEVLLSDQLCARMFSCSCPTGRRYGDRSSCDFAAELLADQLAELPSERPDFDLSYDPACIGAMIDRYAETGCDIEYLAPVDENGQLLCQPPCHLYHGTHDEGEPCVLRNAYYTDCAQGLECIDNTCVDPCGEEIVLPLSGEPCPDSACAAGLFCEQVVIGDPTSERLCLAPRPIGETCRGHLQCESGYCPNGFCSQGLSLGDDCETGFCGAGLVCAESVCEPANAAICSARIPEL